MKLFQTSTRPQKRQLVKAIATIVAATACASAAYAERALEEVIVTAQKKDDTLQTVPMTVNAVTAETISKYNLLDFKDIQNVTPGVTIKAQDSRTSTIAMRGVNVLTDTGYGPGVAIYWNEVNFDIDTATKAMYDIGQIEILRGPQGTLRGITAPAGAVTLTTKRPSFSEIEGNVEQTFGERNLSNSQFGVSLPIIENKLALRVAGLYDHNQTDGIKNIPSGKTNSNETRSGRITLDLRATDDLEVALIHQYTESTGSGQDPVIGCGTGNVLTCLDKSDRKSVVSGPENTTFLRRADTALNVEWTLGDYTLTSITGYREDANQIHRNFGDTGNVQPSTAFVALGPTFVLTGPMAPDQQEVLTHYHRFTQELRFATNDAEFYNWTYGLFGSRDLTYTTVQQPLPVAYFASGFLIGRDTWGVDVNVPVMSEEYGVFTNQSFQFTDKLNAQVGVRYQSKRAVTRLDNTTHPSAMIQSIGFPAAIPGTFNPGPANDEGVTGTASVSYQLYDDVNIYATYGRSFRSGGFTVAPSSPGIYARYQPETSDSIELGVKSRFADGRIQVNADIYYQKYHDFLARSQSGVKTITYDASFTPINSGSDFLNYNADAAVSGAEIQIDALLTDDWQVGLGVSYTDAKFTGGNAYCDISSDPACTTIQTDSLPGGGFGQVGVKKANGRLAGEPNWGVTASSEYTMHFGALDAFARGLYNFQSGRVDDAQLNSAGDTSSYGLFNLFVGVRDPKKVWEVSVWAKNLFNHEQIVRRSSESLYQPLNLDLPQTSAPGDGTIRSGYSGVQVIPERQVGITGKYNFSL